MPKATVTPSCTMVAPGASCAPRCVRTFASPCSEGLRHRVIEPLTIERESNTAMTASADAAIPASSRGLMEGSQALAEAAIRAGCRFYAGYPITPSTEILEYMSVRLPQVGGVCMKDR